MIVRLRDGVLSGSWPERVSQARREKDGHAADTSRSKRKIRQSRACLRRAGCPPAAPRLDYYPSRHDMFLWACRLMIVKCGDHHKGIWSILVDGGEIS